MRKRPSLDTRLLPGRGPHRIDTFQVEALTRQTPGSVQVDLPGSKTINRNFHLLKAAQDEGFCYSLDMNQKHTQQQHSLSVGQRRMQKRPRQEIRRHYVPEG